MYEELDGINPPNDKDILWRYTNFEVFVNLLDTQALYFTRADKFEDPYEGFIPQSIIDAYKQSLKRVTPAEFVKAIMKRHEASRKYVMCNCWHRNVVESMAMWEKYHMRNSGVAIKTTMEKMKNSLLSEYSIYIGKIEYIHGNTDDDQYMQNFLQNDIPLAKKLTYFPYFQKRKEYEHEQEVRLIVDIDPFVRDALNNQTVENVDSFLETGLPDICDIGMLFNIDVSTLIDEVIVSPYAKDWITETLRSVVQKFGFNFQVSPSTLLDDPTSDELTNDGGL
ncbi:MAG: DUF2971 domain-containing protein [Candidatus Poribacteria bacterium]|nr:DUF2971 domain-containing protein [Candidatus Poribacteria bacterium]